MNGPLPHLGRGVKHVLELSADEDEDYLINRKRAKGEGRTEKGKGKAKQRASDDREVDFEDDGVSAAKGDGGKAWYYCNSDGELVIADSPRKQVQRPDPKPNGSGARDADASNDDINEHRANRDGEKEVGGSGGGGGLRRGAALAFAGGSSKAAQVEFDPLDEAVATVCAIIPDVVPTHVRDLLRMESNGPGNVELVVEALLTDSNYPKRSEDKPAGNGSHNRTGEEQTGDDLEDDGEDAVQKEGKIWMEFKNRKPAGRDYEAAALAQLYCDFPSLQQANLKRFFSDNSNFYAPTYVMAQRAISQTEAERGFKLMAPSKARASKGKGRANDELEQEKNWLSANLDRFQSAEVRAQKLAKQLEDEIASGHFFECGCCFSDTAFSQIAICSEGCQFCRDCALMNAETQIGMRKFIVPCMSTSGCQATFPDSEILKFLPRKSREALHKIRQEKEIDLAELDGLEKCPFCPFAYIIENDQERLFHCQRAECSVISCRQCKKKDHLPKTCQEVSDDAKINAVHSVEEAMSSALIRKCPRCSEPYIKEMDSCNKIVCSGCRTLSCYICNKIIDGYGHFANAGRNAPNGSEPGASCALWDDTAKRHFEEVEAARLAAEKIARERAAVSEEDLNRLKADAPPPPPARLAHLPPPVVNAYQRVGGVPIPAVPQPRLDLGFNGQEVRFAAVPPARPQPPAAPAPPAVPPPVPALAPFRPEQAYTRAQVFDLYHTAYQVYAHQAQYAPFLARYAQEAADAAYRKWMEANAQHRRQVAREAARVQRLEDARRQREAQEAREARRRRTQGKS